MYRLHPDLFMYNTKTKKHIRRDGKAFKKQFAADPTIFVESSGILPNVNVPARVPERQPEPLPAPPAIGNPLPQPEPVLTQEEIRKQLSQRAQAKVSDLVAEELKTNPNPYKGKPTQELERMLRAFIRTTLSEEEEAKKAKEKAKATKKPKFVIRKPQTSEDDESESEGESGTEDEDEDRPRSPNCTQWLDIYFFESDTGSPWFYRS